MCGFTIGEYCVAGGPDEFVPKDHNRSAHALQLRANDDFFVVVHRSAVAALYFGDCDEPALVTFHVAVGETHLAHEFHASNFKPDQMVRMVDHSHLVGFGVAHAQPCFIPCMMVRAHLPVHTGLRFSRNDEIPSRKSAVPRMAAFSFTAASILASSSARA